MIKKYTGVISLVSSLILLGLLWLSVAMDDNNIRLVTTGYIIFYLLFGKWLKKQREEDENKN